jgi:hypothetical protein
MGGGHSEAPRGWQADTGQDSHKAEAAGTSNVARRRARAKRAGLDHIQAEGGELFEIYAKGRNVLRAKVGKGGAPC